MLKFLIIHHNTSHGTTHYDTIEATDRDTAIIAFDATETGTIFIDALAELDLDGLKAQLQQPPTIIP